MKCLSIKNPNSYLITSGIKNIENRNRKTEYRGTIYIHSTGKNKIFPIISKELTPVSFEMYTKTHYSHKDKKYNPENNLKYVDFYDNYEKMKPKTTLTEIELLEFKLGKYLSKSGGIFNQSVIGCVDIVDCIQDSDSVWAEKGSYHWVLENAKMFFNPIRFVKGKLGFFEVNLPINAVIDFKNTLYSEI